MVLRSRPDGSAAAARLAALVPERQGGWVPPEEAGAVAEPPSWPGPERGEGATAGRRTSDPSARSRPDLDPVGGTTSARVADGPPGDPSTGAPPVPAGGDLPSRSWSERTPGAHVASGGFRLEPSRRGAAALVLVALLAAVVAGGVSLRQRPQEVPLPVVEAAGVPLPGSSASAAPAGGEVVVAVSGKVHQPGLVRLPAGSRVDDALRAAGGPAPGVDISVLNLARRLVDGEQVLVGVGPPPGSAPVGGGVVAGGLLDLNSATAPDLDALPGIGPVLAQRIVDWRTEHGRFDSVDQLREVDGIGEAKYEDLRGEVTV